MRLYVIEHSFVSRKPKTNTLLYIYLSHTDKTDINWPLI